MSQQAIDLARQLIDRIWNAGETDAARSLMPHSFTWDEDRTIGPTRVSGMGALSLVHEVNANRSAFPDFEMRITDAFADDDGRALVLWLATGTHRGDVRLGNNPMADGRTLEPSGTAVRASGWTLVETRDGVIRSVRQEWNPMSLLQQLAVARFGLDPAALLGLPKGGEDEPAEPASPEPASAEPRSAEPRGAEPAAAEPRAAEPGA